MTVTNVLQEAPVKELLRAVNSEKEYLYFDISVFNVGAAIWIKCTDQYKEINRNTWNGYDFIIENDSTTKYYIAEVLEEKIETLTGHELRRAKKAIKEHL